MEFLEGFRKRLKIVKDSPEGVEGAAEENGAGWDVDAVVGCTEGAHRGWTMCAESSSAVLYAFSAFGVWIHAAVLDWDCAT